MKIKSHLLNISLLGIAVTLFLLKLSMSSQLSASQLSSKDEKKERKTEIGEITVSDEKPQNKIEVLLKDPAMSQRWGHLITDSKRAWRVTKGSRDIIVAVIDTGLDVHHKNLSNNLWVNKGETGTDKNGKSKATNGIDDDGNGYIDDVHGWNFVAGDNDLTDNHGHGTHIAGIIGAEGKDGTGIVGVAPKVSIMALKYYDPKGPGVNNLMNTVKAIRYATQMGAHIINYSGGGLEPSEDERKALALAEKKGVLIVAAAGNERSNSDVHAYYPASYPLTNIISVTAIDKERNVLPSSNFGESSVDLAAPGNEIYSTLPHGKYGYMTGTSQATAFVTGVAALLMSTNKDLHKPHLVKKYLTQTGDVDQRLAGKTRYRRRLNSYRALVIKDTDEPVNGVRVQNTRNIAHTYVHNSDDPSLSLSNSQLAKSSREILKVIGENLPANAYASPAGHFPQN